MNRRDFLKGLGGAAMAAGAAGCVSGRAAFGEPDVRFGVLSDVHLNRPGDEDTLLAAFKFFHDNNVDGVLIAGDISDTGMLAPLVRCGDCWRKAFPDNKSADGRHAEKLFVYGNHDLWGGKGDGSISKDAAASWKTAFGEEYKPIWMKNVKGYTFIGAHWSDMSGIAEFLKQHGGEIDGGKPFFYTQHAHPKDTCIGAWAWGRDNGVSTKALSAFPNAVAFSGHSHYPLTDERSVWQGAFTSINTSSLRYQSIDYSLRENINGNSHGYRGENRKHQMKQPGTGGSRQGMVVSVYGSTLLIERRDFANNAIKVGDDWCISVPCGKEASFEARKARRTAPEFESGAKIGFVRDEAAKTLTLNFPAAKTVRKCRVFEYDVKAILCEEGLELTQFNRRMLAPDYFQAEGDKPVPTFFTFTLEEFVCRGHYRFEVRPIECMGNVGEPLVGQFLV